MAGYIAPIIVSALLAKGGYNKAQQDAQEQEQQRQFNAARLELLKQAIAAGQAKNAALNSLTPAQQLGVYYPKYGAAQSFAADRDGLVKSLSAASATATDPAKKQQLNFLLQRTLNASEPDELNAIQSATGKILGIGVKPTDPALTELRGLEARRLRQQVTGTAPLSAAETQKRQQFQQGRANLAGLLGQRAKRASDPATRDALTLLQAEALNATDPAQLGRIDDAAARLLTPKSTTGGTSASGGAERARHDLVGEALDAYRLLPSETTFNDDGTTTTQRLGPDGKPISFPTFLKGYLAANSAAATPAAPVAPAPPVPSTPPVAPPTVPPTRPPAPRSTPTPAGRPPLPSTINVKGMGDGTLAGVTADGRPIYQFPDGRTMAVKPEALAKLRD